MKISELRAKSAEELKSIIFDSKKEQFNLRMQAGAGSLESPQGFKKARKTIARAKTLLNEEKNGVRNRAPKQVASKKNKKG